jgi:NTP pyrophosphatase (non-canonical NTP hydrolase)
MSEERSILELTEALRSFATEREWERYHTPKNLIMALTGELGELAEIFQWLEPDECATAMADSATRKHVEEELADVFGYLLRLADVLGVSLSDALVAKIESNAERYSIERSRGNARKQ